MKITERTWYSVVFMFIITGVLSTILIIFGNTTRQRVEDNQLVAFKRAVLQALPVDLPGSLSPDDIHQMFTAGVSEDSVHPGVLVFRRNDTVLAYALPVEGPGFWAEIKGVVGISSDMRTLTGLAIYEQNETPGLGGEITKPYFQNQFSGKRLAADGDPIQIRPGTEILDEHSVHAITGATQTSQRVGKFINTQIAAWQRAIGSRK